MKSRAVVTFGLLLAAWGGSVRAEDAPAATQPARMVDQVPPEDREVAQWYDTIQQWADAGTLLEKLPLALADKTALIVASDEGCEIFDRPGMLRLLKEFAPPGQRATIPRIEGLAVARAGDVALCLPRYVTVFSDGVKRRGSELHILIETPAGWRAAFFVDNFVKLATPDEGKPAQLVPGTRATDRGEEVDRVKKAVQAIARIVQQRDAGALKGMFATKGALLIEKRGRRIVVKDRAQLMAEADKLWFKEDWIAWKTYRLDQVRVIQRGPLAIVDTQRTVRTEDGQVATKAQMFVMVKEKGQWRIVLDVPAPVRIGPPAPATATSPKT